MYQLSFFQAKSCTSSGGSFRLGRNFQLETFRRELTPAAKALTGGVVSTKVNITIIIRREYLNLAGERGTVSRPLFS